MKLHPLLQVIMITLISCTTQKISTIAGSDYDKEKNKTSYFVLPLGSTAIPGEWVRTNYNKVSNQQFFKNGEGISIAIAFTPITGYDFNKDHSKKGFEFTKAFYAWDAGYFEQTHHLQQEKIEENENLNYIIWRVSGISNSANFDTYFLFGEKNGHANSFSITQTDKWTKEQKINFLKELYLQN